MPKQLPIQWQEFSNDALHVVFVDAKTNLQILALNKGPHYKDLRPIRCNKKTSIESHIIRITFSFYTIVSLLINFVF
jgi:hypothetical protein